ncbi:MAG TPA: hypothetical protein VJN65_00275 [Bacteroidota bacterium]|nr:hypothetical protein [Bacteroidota bacterium]
MLDEPGLVFGHGQSLEDPRDGLALFGPLTKAAPFGISYGLVGTEAGIQRFYGWLKRTRRPIVHEEVSKRTLWVPFPGFEAVFGIPIAERATCEKTISSDRLREILKEDDSYQRVYKVVNLYAQPILDFYEKADEDVNIWFILSPESVFAECRPKSKVEDPQKRVGWEAMKKRKEMAILSREGQKFIFQGQEEDYFAYGFDNDFRRQLKARMILKNVKDPLQIIRESTLAPFDFLNQLGYPERELEPDSQVAWNLLSTVFYKAGGKPWKLRGIREGVCYLGMVYKKLEEKDRRSACCAAQMFLDSGDGVVFKGAVGPWKSTTKEDYHLDYHASKEIIERAVEAYKNFYGMREDPAEIFIHGKTYLNEEEWSGFSTVKSRGINVVGVRISRGNLKLFRPGRFPVMRGTAFLETEKVGYLWSTGFIPRLRTYPYQGVPYPLRVEICQGEKDLMTVLRDILALTKLNYNSCRFSDGEPITLRFANKIGEILTAGPIEKDKAPLPFKFYI